MSCADSRSFSRNVIDGSGGGCLSGLSSDQMTMYPEYSTITKIPGRKPARNTWMIETLACTA